jgi:hypothetical protein
MSEIHNIEIFGKTEMNYCEVSSEWKNCIDVPPPDNETVLVRGILNDSTGRYYEQIAWCINGKWLMNEQWLYQEPIYWKEIE